MRCDRPNWRSVSTNVDTESNDSKSDSKSTALATLVENQRFGRNKPYKFHTNTTIRDKLSIGVACCRISKFGRPEMLFICKRYTYAFNLIAHGRYNEHNKAEMIELLGGTTVDEKLDLLSLNFSQIRYRIYLNKSQVNQTFFMAKNKFESTFVVDNGVKLRKLIAKSAHSNKIWEIPKGHKLNKSEPDIHCAVREFEEETGITKKSYKLFPGAKKTYSYIDAGVRYTNIYYIAFTRSTAAPRINFNNQDQIDEICDIRWMNIDDIRQIDETKRLATFVRPIFNYIKLNI